MNIRNRAEIRHTASQALHHAAGDPRKIAIIYGGIVCLLALASTCISYYLNGEIANTGGLSNMGLRSILTTIQAILPFIQMLFALGLEVGYCRAMLDIARGRSAQPRTLLNGLQRFWPMLTSTIFQALIYLAVIIGAMYLSAWIFLMLPISNGFYEIMEPLMESMTVLNSAYTFDDATLFAAAEAMAPMMWIFLAVSCIGITPVMYQYRMVVFCLADSDSPRGLSALRESRQMMRRNRFALFRLDLGFWWYYLLQVLISLICYGDVLLPMVGITLPWSGTVSYFLFLVLSLALQLVVYCCFMNRVTVTYATAYDALRPKPQTGGVALGNIFDM